MKRYNQIFPYKESFLFFRILNKCIKNTKLIETNLKDFAYNQLKKAGLFDGDSDYGGMLGDNVMELINKFCDQGHSGYSAPFVNYLFNRLANYKPITPIENPMNTGEYNDVSLMSSQPEGTFFQSNIIPDMFSDDGGESWYILVDVPHKDNDGTSYCTYDKSFIKEFPFNYDDYKK